MILPNLVRAMAIKKGARVLDLACGQGFFSRAFAEAADFVTLTRHLLADGGRWAAMKGAPEQELARLPEGVVVEKVITLQVPELEAARSLVVLGVKK